MDAFAFLASVFRSLLLDREGLTLEDVAMHRQVAVLRRGVRRRKLEDEDRIFWIGRGCASRRRSADS